MCVCVGGLLKKEKLIGKWCCGGLAERSFSLLLERERPLANLGACYISISLSLCVCDVNGSFFPDTGDDLPYWMCWLARARLYILYDKKPCDSLHKPPVATSNGYLFIYSSILCVFKQKKEQKNLYLEPPPHYRIDPKQNLIALSISLSLFKYLYSSLLSFFPTVIVLKVMMGLFSVVLHISLCL